MRVEGIKKSKCEATNLTRNDILEFHSKLYDNGKGKIAHKLFVLKFIRVNKLEKKMMINRLSMADIFH